MNVASHYLPFVVCLSIMKETFSMRLHRLVDWLLE